MSVPNIGHNKELYDIAENADVVKSVSNRRWKHSLYNEQEFNQLVQKAGIDPVIAEILARRGIKLNQASVFLDPKLKDVLPDPHLLKDMDLAVDTIIRAIVEQRKITVFGDYDVDGASSSALLYRFFRLVGITIDIYIPNRITEGYGPNLEAFKSIRANGTNLIITVDCGTASADVIAEGRKMGLDIVVIDHHLAGDATKLPVANAVVNPNRCDDHSGLNYLAAVGVSYLVVVAVMRRLIADKYVQSSEMQNLLYLLDIVALGTVCDVMPLVHLNRVFVKQGLKIMKQTRNTGVRALLDCLDIKGEISTYHLGFVLGPRINAGGRVGMPSSGAKLLTNDDYGVSLELSQQLNNWNTERKYIESKVLEDAIKMAEVAKSPFIIVSGKMWHQGVIGIVASRLQDRFAKPTIVISIDENNIGKASCRSIDGINIGDLVHEACKSNIIISGGGHAMAAGFLIAEDKIGELHRFLENKVQASTVQVLMSKIRTYDAHINTQHINPEFISKVNTMGPFGNGNEMPKFRLSNVVVCNATVFQSTHISCWMRADNNITSPLFKAMAFRSIDSPMAEILLTPGKVVDLIVTLSLNEWKNKIKPEVIIHDVIIP